MMIWSDGASEERGAEAKGGTQEAKSLTEINYSIGSLVRQS